MPLYRALRQDEIEAGFVLIPKSQTAFRAHPKLPLVLPVYLGEAEEHAVRDHQCDGQYLTRGVSCTTEWTVALRYARASNVIVSIDEAVCERLGIRRFRVREHTPLELIIHPEDEEVILVYDKNGVFPKEIVTAVFEITRPTIS
jgi:hypothetical protein